MSFLRRRRTRDYLYWLGVLVPTSAPSRPAMKSWLTRVRLRPNTMDSLDNMVVVGKQFIALSSATRIAVVIINQSWDKASTPRSLLTRRMWPGKRKNRSSWHCKSWTRRRQSCPLIKWISYSLNSEVRCRPISHQKLGFRSKWWISDSSPKHSGTYRIIW